MSRPLADNPFQTTSRFIPKAEWTEFCQLGWGSLITALKREYGVVSVADIPETRGDLRLIMHYRAARRGAKALERARLVDAFIWGWFTARKESLISKNN